MDHAQTLFGGTTPQTETASTAAAEQPGIADRLYGTAAPATPAADKPLTEDAASTMYGSAFSTELPDGIPGLDAPAARAVAQALGAEHQDVSEFMREFQRVQHEPPTDEQRAMWRADAQADLKLRGFTEHDLSLARKLVARDPRVGELLDRTGLGDRADVVRGFIHLARRQAVAGRLK
jgi:hypothetical protein